MALRSTSMVETVRAEPVDDTSLFERFPWVYAFFRERLFRDDTELIVESFWGNDGPPSGSTLIELGCGPGFYARRLSARFSELKVIGIDRSLPQLELASRRADRCGLENCGFEWGDAQEIGRSSESVDLVVASRLITVLPDPARTLSEVHRVLKPGGHCFIAEPRPHPIARIPLDVMWAVAGITSAVNRRHAWYREPVTPTLLTLDEFTGLITSQPWKTVRIWVDGRYQYAVGTKA